MRRFLLRNILHLPGNKAKRSEDTRPLVGGIPLPVKATRTLLERDLTKKVLGEIADLQRRSVVSLRDINPLVGEVDATAMFSERFPLPPPPPLPEPIIEAYIATLAEKPRAPGPVVVTVVAAEEPVEEEEEEESAPVPASPSVLEELFPEEPIEEPAEPAKEPYSLEALMDRKNFSNAGLQDILRVEFGFDQELYSMTKAQLAAKIIELQGIAAGGE